MDSLMAALRRELLRIGRYPLWTVNEFVSILLLIVPIALMAISWSFEGASFRDKVPSSLAFMVAGTIVWQLFGKVIFEIGYALRDEMLEGTLQTNLVAPSPYAASIAGKALVSGFLSLGQALLIWAIGYILMGFRGGVALVEGAIVFILLSAGLSGLALAFGGLILSLKSPSVWVNLVNAVVSLAGGVLFPISLLPLPIRAFSYILPTTYGADLMRLILLGSKPLMDWRLEAGVLLAAGLLGPLAGVVSFNKLLARAKTTGTLAHY